MMPWKEVEEEEEEEAPSGENMCFSRNPIMVASQQVVASHQSFLVSSISISYDHSMITSRFTPSVQNSFMSMGTGDYDFDYQDLQDFYGFRIPQIRKTSSPRVTGNDLAPGPGQEEMFRQQMLLEHSNWDDQVVTYNLQL